MNDFSKHLPLSQGGDSGDESDVTSDWRPLTGAALRLLADLLGGASDDDWERETLGGGSVEERTTLLARRFDSSQRVLLRRAVGERLGVSPLPAPFRSRGALLETLRRQAAARIALGGRRGIGDLRAVVVDGLDLAATVGHPLVLPHRATGATALVLASTARTSLAAVIRGRTLVATDAGWRIGQGPAIAAPAAELVLFLAGRASAMPGADGRHEDLGDG